MQEVKGFVHQDQEGRYFLTDSPVLKSCCKAKPKEGEALYIETDDLLEVKRLYTFEGTLGVDGIFHGKKLESEPMSFLPFVILLLSIGLIFRLKWGR